LLLSKAIKDFKIIGNYFQDLIWSKYVWFWDQHDLGRIKSWWNTNINHQYKLTVLQLSMIKWGNKCGEKFTYYIVPKNGIFCYVCKYDYKQCLSWKGLQCCEHTVECWQTKFTYMKTKTNLFSNTFNSQNIQTCAKW